MSLGFRGFSSLSLDSAALGPMHGERECHGVRGAVKEESCSVQSGQEAERETGRDTGGGSVGKTLLVQVRGPQFPDWLTGQSL